MTAPTVPPGVCKLVVDGRGLEPPEPLVRVMEALDQIGPGEHLLFVIQRDPKPLFRILERNGYGYRVEHDPDGCFQIRIWQKPSATPA